MDKETKVAYEIVRQRIVERLDTLYDAQQAGVKLPSGDINSLKKWRRFGAAFAWDPEVFQNVLEKPDMPDQQLISELRKAETQLMRKWGVIDKIPLHHIVANRTGGDLGIRTPVDTWLETRKRVFDATGAKPGDGPSNLNAASQFDELAHLGRTGAKGSVFAEAGVQSRADFPFLHRAGQNLAAKAGDNPKLVLGTAQEQAEVLIPSVKQQQARFAETTATPEVQAQRKVLTKAGYPEAFAADTPIERIQEIAGEIRGTEIPKQFASAFDLSKGAVTLNRNMFGNRLTRLVLPSAGGAALSLALGAQDLQAREAAVAKDPSFINKLQRDLTKTEMAADAVGAVPNPATPAAETAGFGAALTNIGIDVVRDPIGTIQAIGGGIRYFAENAHKHRVPSFSILPR